MIFNSIRSINKKFKAEYGELVIACDHVHTWRKDTFPYYKHSRKLSRDKSNIDWVALFEIMQEIRDDLRTYFPYRVIQIDGCEADDAIGAVSRYVAGKTLIVSVDKDFAQLHNEFVTQYNPVGKKFVETPDGTTIFLRRHIIRGDVGDGIPNILSDDDCFVVKKRQTRISEKQLQGWLFGDMEQLLTPEAYKHYKRNERLIDLSQTPERLITEIMKQYKDEEGKDRSKIFNYLVSKRMSNIMQDISDF